MYSTGASVGSFQSPKPKLPLASSSSSSSVTFIRPHGRTWNPIFESSHPRNIASLSVSRSSSLSSSNNNSNNNNEGGIEEFGIRRDEKWLERSKRWVVIVDDEESIRKAVGQYLFDQGYQVTACADGPTALRVCKSKVVNNHNKNDDKGNNGQGTTTAGAVPDMIVSDVRMPGMDGLELLREIRQDELLLGVPVVLLTAKGMTQDRIAGFKAGADAYLPKPFDPEELISIIDNSISRHEILSGGSVGVEDIKKDLDEVKYLLLEKGGAGVSNGWVEATNVFLTPDEREVLELLCQGLMTKEIASATHLSTRRVEQLLTRMFRKTHVKNRTELVRWAVSTGNVQI
mmetsp:Transcript_20258/g.31293  ORF Transcript_20258/g.31293 Transcript_20258/m.31293 type:complete len:344 (+) Transcript_20258:3190-4221(+)